MRSLLAVLLALNLSGCGDAYRYLKSGEVGWALKKELRDQKSTRVELSKLTKFEWDEVFVFGPYFPASEVFKRLSLPAAECAAAIPVESTDDGEMLLVFRLKGKVVHTEIHYRWHGDFTPSPKEPLTPQTAVFAVVAAGKGSSGQDWLKLRPIN